MKPHLILKEEGGVPIRFWTGVLRKDAPPLTHVPSFGVRKDPEPEITGPDVEASALEQLVNVARLPFIHPHGIAVMPDVHFGIGATVGSVIATDGAIVPAAVGVDIGCGMNAIRTSLKASDLPESLAALRHAIEAKVPTGFEQHRDPRWPVGSLENFLGSLPEREDLGRYSKDGVSGLLAKASHQLGSLGGGNHFIEVCLDENQDVWVMLHSGSRGIGNIIGRHYIEKAQKLCEDFYVPLPHKDLAFIPEGSPVFAEYWRALNWAQEYATQNRALMMKLVLIALRDVITVPFDLTTEAVSCHHNYVNREHHFGRNLLVTRKGAISAREGQLGIIPGSMGAKSFIVSGKGAAESYCSCSHGAGRRMGRKEATRVFTVADLEAQTQGVECRKDSAVLDEIPGAYKNIDEVMAQQADLVEIRHTLKQILCVKGEK